MNVRFLEYYPDLVRTARHGGLDLEDAEEIAQDALVLLVQKAASREVQVLSTDSIQNRGGQVRSLRGWLRDVLALLLKNRIRYRIRHYSPSSRSMHRMPSRSRRRRTGKSNSWHSESAFSPSSRRMKQNYSVWISSDSDPTRSRAGWESQRRPSG